MYLAAAVSDFYVPPAEMVVHKIQSRASDGLTIHLRNVPKVLGLLRDEWCPEAVLCSFKLETNANILRAKSAGALKAYRVDAVVANVLQTRASEVTIFRASPGVQPAVLGPVHADAAAEVPTAGVVGARITLDGLSGGTLEVTVQSLASLASHVADRITFRGGVLHPPPLLSQPSMKVDRPSDWWGPLLRANQIQTPGTAARKRADCPAGCWFFRLGTWAAGCRAP